MILYLVVYIRFGICAPNTPNKDWVSSTEYKTKIITF